MTDQKTILISGASIAGPALAHWLTRYGWGVTLVEQADVLRSAGQNVDVRGAGVDVLRRMGLRDAAMERRTGESGTAFIGSRGQVVASFPADRSEVDGATAELEILRGDLAGLLVQQLEGTCEIVFGDTITGLRTHDHGVAVRFARGGEGSFDVVIAADGLRSSTRGLMGLDPELRLLGLETTYLTIPRTPDDDDTWRWYNASRGRSITLRPDPYGTTRATLSSLVDTSRAPAPRRARDEQVAHVRQVFAAAGWQTDRVLAALDDAEDLYYESLGQVRAERWSTGRTALVGDAAYCASPLSGMGTTLALVGAYVLAGELARSADHVEAFGRYEALVRPYVDKAQKLPPGGARLGNPKTRLGVGAFNTVVKLLSSPRLGTLGDKVFSRPADQVRLPDYRPPSQPDRADS